MTANFEKIEEAADALPLEWNTWQYDVKLLVMRAYENAADTVYVEKARPEDELDVLALATLAEMLACETHPKEALDWFEAQGVQW